MYTYSIFASVYRYFVCMIDNLVCLFINENIKTTPSYLQMIYCIMNRMKKSNRRLLLSENKKNWKVFFDRKSDLLKKKEIYSWQKSPLDNHWIEQRNVKTTTIKRFNMIKKENKIKCFKTATTWMIIVFSNNTQVVEWRRRNINNHKISMHHCSSFFCI